MVVMKVVWKDTSWAAVMAVRWGRREAARRVVWWALMWAESWVELWVELWVVSSVASMAGTSAVELGGMWAAGMAVR